jgi:hypothetical protein
MERALHTHFEAIFSDAHVIDVDLSRWDTGIDLYVLADHMPRTPDGRLALFRVEFVHVREFQLEIDPRGRDGLAADEHVQWLIDDFEVTQDHEALRISLWGFAAAPRLAVLCENVEIHPFDLNVLDDLFPGWNAPRRGLARPGPAAMQSTV